MVKVSTQYEILTCRYSSDIDAVMLFCIDTFYTTELFRKLEMKGAMASGTCRTPRGDVGSIISFKLEICITIISLL